MGGMPGRGIWSHLACYGMGFGWGLVLLDPGRRCVSERPFLDCWGSPPRRRRVGCKVSWDRKGVGVTRPITPHRSMVREKKTAPQTMRMGVNATSSPASTAALTTTGFLPNPAGWTPWATTAASGSAWAEGSGRDLVIRTMSRRLGPAARMRFTPGISDGVGTSVERGEIVGVPSERMARTARADRSHGANQP